MQTTRKKTQLVRNESLLRKPTKKWLEQESKRTRLSQSVIIDRALTKLMNMPEDGRDNNIYEQ